MNIFKKFFLGLSIVTFGLAQPSYAQSSSGNVLQQIKLNTDNILSTLNQSPAYLSAFIAEITKMAKSWNAVESSQDDDIIIGTNQGPFGQLYSAFNNNLTTQLSAGQALTQQYLTASSQKTSGNTADPYSQDALSYSIVLGSMLTKSNPMGNNTAYNTAKKNQAQSMQSYIKYASGTNNWLPQAPGAGTPANARYQNFFYTLSAVQSYVAYVLSDLPNQQTTTPLFQQLIQQASDPKLNFFGKIAKEPLGPILRQILMYNAQTFVLMARILKVQQEQLASLAMTNTLLIMSVSNTAGQQLYQRALQTS